MKYTRSNLLYIVILLVLFTDSAFERMSITKENSTVQIDGNQDGSQHENYALVE